MNMLKSLGGVLITCLVIGAIVGFLTFVSGSGPAA